MSHAVRSRGLVEDRRIRNLPSLHLRSGAAEVVELRERAMEERRGEGD